MVLIPGAATHDEIPVPPGHGQLVLKKAADIGNPDRDTSPTGDFQSRQRTLQCEGNGR